MHLLTDLISLLWNPELKQDCSLDMQQAFSENMMDDVSSSDNIKLVQRLLRSSSALNIRPNPSEEQLSGTCCCCRNRQAKLQICHCQELDNLALKASSSRRSRSCTKHHKKRKSNTARFQRQATHLAQPASLQSAKSEASESISAHHQRLSGMNAASLRNFVCQSNVRNSVLIHNCTDEAVSSLTFEHCRYTPQSVSCTTMYDFHELVGGGRFGKVYRCVEKATGLQFAAKRLRCKKSAKIKGIESKNSVNNPDSALELEPVNKEDVLMEMSIMKRLNHPNIAKLYDVYEEETSMTLILEYVGGGELFERVLSDQSRLTELDAVLYTQQIIEAVQYLHKNFVLHLDLKPENILCTSQSTHYIKIIDFGLSKTFAPNQELFVDSGTPEFMAPETLEFNAATSASDMWSVGVITYIFEDLNQTIANVINCEWNYDDYEFNHVTEEAKDFVSNLLVKNESGRATASQCLHHEWLTAPISGRKKFKPSTKDVKETKFPNLKETDVGVTGETPV